MNSAYLKLKKIYQELDFEERILYEGFSTEFSFSIPYDELDKEMQASVKKLISKKMYSLWNERFNVLEWRLKQIQERTNKKRSIFYIICLLPLRKFIFEFIGSKFKENLLSLYLFNINNLRASIQKLKKSILNGYLQVLFDRRRDKYNGPCTIAGNHVFMTIQDNPHIPGRLTVYHYFNPIMAQNMTQSYLSLFEALTKSEEYNKLIEVQSYISNEQVGNLMYNSCLQKLDEEVKYINEKYGIE